MKYQLRPYQREAIAGVKSVLAQRPILVAPTGSGKTVMGVTLVEELRRPTLWLAHRTELVEQAAAHLGELGLYVGIIKAGFSADPLALVQVASVQTLTRRPKPHAALIVLDEAHHVAADSYREILDAYPDVPVVGLTATPFRLDGRGLGDTFGELVVAAYTDELVEAGYLHAPKVYATKTPDLDGIKILGGDYQLGALAKRTNTGEQNADIVQTWKRRARVEIDDGMGSFAYMRTVCFAVNVEHSKTIVAAFNAAGVPAEHLDGKTPGG